jgi:phosphoribosylformylglycinamidine cyclo-ligase
VAIDYKSAGVDIEKGDRLVDWLKQSQAGSPPPHAGAVLDGIGGFASIFRPDLSGMKEPCLVSATDGVGTKLKLAIELKNLQTLGQDLVAMCANDLICTGAQPLFFLDYFATSKLDMAQAQPFLQGLRTACHQAQMVLIGGETAEMPGLYQEGDFDCAGFAVGMVDRAQIIGPQNVQTGMVALGLGSSGFHSNGYSLVRRLFSSQDDLKQWGTELLRPTHLYVEVTGEILKKERSSVAAMAHITGGGIHNIARVLPDHLSLKLQAWDWPDLFKEAQKRAEISNAEMLKTFNCGVGFVYIIAADQLQTISQLAQAHGFATYELGEIIQSDGPSIVFPEGWDEA